VNPQVSIITATYNDGRFLNECIDSVINQVFMNWEWIVVNNGSSDNTEQLLKAIDDPRIHVCHLSENLGVSGGRNHGLKQAIGTYICFLDGDDILPSTSLQARLKAFESDASLEFVDGCVKSFKGDLSNLVGEYKPAFQGNPRSRLLSLDGSVFYGNTWMIKRVEGKSYFFNEAISHGEELMLFIELSVSGNYGFTDQCVLNYRRTDHSAMANLDGLRNGYLSIAERMKEINGISLIEQSKFEKKARSIMFKSYAKQGQWMNAVKTWFEFARL
jgi:teichuronic acid biosynthesis glycosyltransferase TuaG